MSDGQFSLQIRIQENNMFLKALDDSNVGSNFELHILFSCLIAIGSLHSELMSWVRDCLATKCNKILFYFKLKTSNESCKDMQTCFYENNYLLSRVMIAPLGCLSAILPLFAEKYFDALCEI